MTMPQYQESCFDCDGLHLDVSYSDVVDGKQLISVICRECGATWEDYEVE